MAIANLNKLSPIIPHPLVLQASLADTGTECNKRAALCAQPNKCSLASAPQCIKPQPESLTQAVMIHWAVHCVEGVLQQALGQVASGKCLLQESLPTPIFLKRFNNFFFRKHLLSDF